MGRHRAQQGQAQAWCPPQGDQLWVPEGASDGQRLQVMINPHLGLNHSGD